jgi:hypothetical protein
MGTMTSRRHSNSWRELGGESRMKSAVTKLLNVLENAGLLLPEAAAENEEVTISSGNVRKYFDFFGIPLTSIVQSRGSLGIQELLANFVMGSLKP